MPVLPSSLIELACCFRLLLLLLLVALCGTGRGVMLRGEHLFEAVIQLRWAFCQPFGGHAPLSLMAAPYDVLQPQVSQAELRWCHSPTLTHPACVGCHVLRAEPGRQYLLCRPQGPSSQRQGNKQPHKGAEVIT